MTTDPTRLSHRGQALIDSPTLAPYIQEHFARVEHAWDPARRPDGYIGLCIAENKLGAPRLMQALDQIEVPSRVLGYDAMSGNFEFRRRLASFMGRSFLGRVPLPEQLAVVAGAGSVLEMLGYTLCNPGEGILVPTPSYAGFWPDFETRDQLELVPVHCASDQDFALTLDALDHALESASCPVRALLLTTPNNPLGRVYARDELMQIAKWTRARGLHLIADEVYALSTFGATSFISAASLRDELGDDVHLIWAFSKDFGASGLRCGVLYSQHTGVVQAVSELAYWSAVSGHTQHLLSEFIADDDRVDRYLAESRAQLRTAYACVSEALGSIGVAHLKAEAAFFVLVDLRPYLREASWAAERELWRRIVDEGQVNLTPGEACRINEPGFFRLCYASETPAALNEALRRLATILS